MLPIGFNFLPSFSWLDIVFFLILLFYTIEGIEEGLLDNFLHGLSFFISFLFGLFLYRLVAQFFILLSFSSNVSYPVAFFLVGIGSEFVLLTILAHFANRFIKKETPKSLLGLSLLGAVPGFFSGCILLCFFLTLAVTLPVATVIKQSVTSSFLGSMFILTTQDTERIFFGNDQLLTFSAPLQNRVVEALSFAIETPTSDETQKKQLIMLLNNFREKKGLFALTSDQLLTPLAQKHAEDMLKENYFSPVTPDGLSPLDRAVAEGISVSQLEENIGFSQSPSLVLNGMLAKNNSLLLSNTYQRIGVGVASAGSYGTMFVLDFAD